MILFPQNASEVFVNFLNDDAFVCRIKKKEKENVLHYSQMSKRTKKPES